MEVDLLRPGTVPMSPDTVLWFEFLLNEQLLTTHLQKNDPDPSPANLIIKFTSVNLEAAAVDVGLTTTTTTTSDGMCYVFETVDDAAVADADFKQTALKVLCLKILAHMKWNLDFYLKLPFKVQVILMEDLIRFTSGKTGPDLYTIVKNAELESASGQFLFALIFYHRWVIRTVTGYTNATHQAPNFSNGGDINYAASVVDDQVNFYSCENVKQSVQFLEESFNWEACPLFLTSECFTIAKRQNINWDLSEGISKDELAVQISYDIAVYFFYEENYQGATFYFKKCLSHIEGISGATTAFVTVEKLTLDSYLSACSDGGEKEDSSDLLQQMHSCIHNQYIGILNVLQKDNNASVIPLYCRTNLELNISEALLSGKFTVARDFLPKVLCLNVVRNIFNHVPIYNFNLNVNNVDAFIWSLCNCNEDNELLLWPFLAKQLIRCDVGSVGEKLWSAVGEKGDFKAKYNLLLQTSEEFEQHNLPLNVITYDLAEIFNKGDPLLENHLLEQAVVKCYDPEKLKLLLSKSGVSNPNKPLWKINSCWAISIPLQSALASMSKGQQQDFSYVLLIKSRELALIKNWSLSLRLLEILKGEIKNGNDKLTCLINFEILLIKINKFLEEWNAISSVEQMELAEECVKCLQAGGYILPRTEIMEQCILCLINLKHWDFLVGFEKRSTFIEIAVALTGASQCLAAQFKGNKKFSRDIWEIVLPIFLSSNSTTKRSTSGGFTAVQRDSHNGHKSLLLTFFNNLREVTVLNVVISMLTRMYNILKDESTIELTMELTGLWPAVISNAASYNTRSVSEMLFQVLESAIAFHPTNTVWLKLLGDLSYGNGFFDKSLKYYLTVLALSSDYFTSPIKTDDHILKRTLKSCFNLGCYTQSAVLSQFLDEPDYMQAFHSLSEQKFCNDAIDGYYHCFWDTSILEYLIHVHHKRYEFQRRKKGIHVMGLLELNSNNNQEIHQESCNSRKRAFLRALYRYFLYLF